MQAFATMRLIPEITWRPAHTGASTLDARLLPLLIAIRTHATLRAGALDVGLSYRAAWSLLGDASDALGMPLVDLQRGRGARLTAAGEDLVVANARAAVKLREARLDIDLRPRNARGTLDASRGLVVAASHDLLLDALCDRWAKPIGLVGDLTFKGSLESLAALARGDAQIGGFHVAMPVEETVVAAFHRLLDSRRDVLLRFAEREQGLIVARGNPKRLRSLADVAAKHVRFVNRQRGSGTRLLIDQLLKQSHVEPAAIRGYASEEYTHLAVAAIIAAGRADAGFGLKAAASRFRLDFIPMRRETYWLALRARRLESELGQRLLEGLTGEPLRRAARGLAGYSIREAGTVVSIAAVLN
jgi:putative molybdopterin biosynthesis protein